jgi:pentatricopeptide repeat protein
VLFSNEHLTQPSYYQISKAVPTTMLRVARLRSRARIWRHLSTRKRATARGGDGAATAAVPTHMKYPAYLSTKRPDGQAKLKPVLVKQKSGSWGVANPAPIVDAEKGRSRHAKKGRPALQMDLLKHARKGRSAEAHAVLVQMEEAGECVGFKDLTSIISAFARNGDIAGAKRVFSSLPARGFEPDAWCYAALANAHANAGDVEGLEKAVADAAAKQAVSLPMLNAWWKATTDAAPEDFVERLRLHAIKIVPLLEADGWRREGPVWKDRTNGYGGPFYTAGGPLELALQTLDGKEAGLLPCTLRAITSQISTRAQAGDVDGALRLFSLLSARGIEPDEWCYGALANAYAHSGDAEGVKGVITKAATTSCISLALLAALWKATNRASGGETKPVEFLELLRPHVSNIAPLLKADGWLLIGANWLAPSTIPKNNSFYAAFGPLELALQSLDGARTKLPLIWWVATSTLKRAAQQGDLTLARRVVACMLEVDGAEPQGWWYVQLAIAQAVQLEQPGASAEFSRDFVDEMLAKSDVALKPRDYFDLAAALIRAGGTSAAQDVMQRASEAEISEEEMHRLQARLSFLLLGETGVRLKECAKSGDVQGALAALTELRTRGEQMTPHMYQLVLNACSRSPLPEMDLTAQRLFREIEPNCGATPDVGLYRALANVLAVHSDVAAVRSLLGVGKRMTAAKAEDGSLDSGSGGGGGGGGDGRVPAAPLQSLYQGVLGWFGVGTVAAAVVPGTVVTGFPGPTDVEDFNLCLKAVVRSSAKASIARDMEEVLSDLDAAGLEPDIRTHAWRVAAYVRLDDARRLAPALLDTKAAMLRAEDNNRRDELVVAANGATASRMPSRVVGAVGPSELGRALQCLARSPFDVFREAVDASIMLKQSKQVRGYAGGVLSTFDFGALIRCCWPKHAAGGKPIAARTSSARKFFCDYLDTLATPLMAKITAESQPYADASVCEMYLRCPGIELEDFVDQCAERGILYDQAAAVNAADYFWEERTLGGLGLPGLLPPPEDGGLYPGMDYTCPPGRPRRG